MRSSILSVFVFLPPLLFFLHVTPPTHIYTLSLHDALPIFAEQPGLKPRLSERLHLLRCRRRGRQDRKSTRLNSSHLVISYAVFCLKKKKTRVGRHAPQCVGA